MGASPSRWVVTEDPISAAADVFPVLPGQGFWLKKSPSFSSHVRSVASGREVRTAYWSSPKWAFEVGYAFLRKRPPSQDELMRLWDFFAAQQGKFGAFFVQDPTDTLVTAGPLGVGDGASTSFQATRMLAGQASEPVLAFWRAPAVFVNGAATTAFSVGPWGQITFAAAPAAGAVLTWSGAFLFVARFDADELPAEQMFADLWSAKGVKLLSVKP